MNHCVLEVQVNKAPTVRYTQDDQTPIAEMEVLLDGLRQEDPPGQLKVIGWGNMAQELQRRVQTSQKLIIEGRLRMNTISRQDGTKEKKAELTLSKFHNISEASPPSSQENSSKEAKAGNASPASKETNDPRKTEEDSISWNSAPLIPENDEIPF